MLPCPILVGIEFNLVTWVQTEAVPWGNGCIVQDFEFEQTLFSTSQLFVTFHLGKASMGILELRTASISSAIIVLHFIFRAWGFTIDSELWVSKRLSFRQTTVAITITDIGVRPSDIHFYGFSTLWTSEAVIIVKTSEDSPLPSYYSNAFNVNDA